MEQGYFSRTEQGYFSRIDNESIFRLTEDFLGRDGYVWFIELESTGEWITEENKLTRDHLYAKQFKSKMSAVEYCIVQKLGVEYIQTEHEFTPGSRSQNPPS